MWYFFTQYINKVCSCPSVNVENIFHATGTSKSLYAGEELVPLKLSTAPKSLKTGENRYCFLTQVDPSQAW